jgi:hypothetical protein
MDNYSDQTTGTSIKHNSVRPADGKMTDQKMSDQNVRGEFPRFIFVRRRDIELKVGLLLAGNLILDEAKPRDFLFFFMVDGSCPRSRGNRRHG